MILLILWFVGSMWLVNYQCRKQIKLQKIRERLAELETECKALRGDVEVEKKATLILLNGGRE